jgi:thymidylate synthase (FAD)
MKVNLLDHGYLEYIEHWGSDERIVEAARMSTGKGFLGWGPFNCPDCEHLPESEVILLSGTRMGKQGCEKCKGKGFIQGDEKLLAYLNDHKHTTPFEMAGAVIEVKAPIMVFREWHRHRTQSYNEMSARYTPLPNENYVPTVERLLMNSKTGNKQAGTIKGAAELTAADADVFRHQLAVMYDLQQSFYERWLDRGVPKELARIDLPVGRYSRMRASANLLNWLKFITLRSAKDAQYEIRVYSNALADMLKDLFPRTMEIFNGTEK